MKFDKNKHKKVYIVISTIALILIVIAALEILGITSLTKNESTEARTTSVQPTADEDFTDGTDRAPNTSSKQEGTVDDNGGDNSSAPPPASQWTTSPSGVITLYTPAANSILSAGDTVSGKTSTPTVSFRLIDSVSGVIAQGELKVINGTFSGTFNFTTKATEGRLDIFSTSADGREQNNIEVPIRFK